MRTLVSASARPHPTRTLLILSAAAISFALGQTSIVPAIGELMHAFHTDSAGVAWTLTGYLACAAVFTPIFGRLGDMFGKKRMLVISLGLFAAGCVLSAVGHTLGIVVAGRVLQGTGGGIFPLCFAIIRDEFPRDRVRASIGLISAIAGIGGGLGLVVGGLLVDHASYHWIFWLGGAGAVAAGLGVAVLVPESPNRAPGRVDVRGAALMAVGLVLPLLAISKANVWGWVDPRTLGLTAVGLAVLALWVAVERRTAVPLANIDTLTRRPVLMTNVATLLTGFGMFGSFILVPQLAEAPTSTSYGFGASATHAGLLMLPGALLMLVAGPVSGMLGERLGSRVPLAIGGIIAAFGLAMLGLVHGSQLEVAVFSAVMFAGIGLAFSAMPNLIVDAVPPAETGEATGFNALVRSVGSSLGSQVSGAVLAGSIVAGGHPSEAGFRTAFLISAGIAVVAAATAMFIPAVTGEHGPHLGGAAEVGAAGPLGEPAYAGERR
jgi:MFS family permease